MVVNTGSLGPAHSTGTVVAIRATYYTQTRDTSNRLCATVQAGEQHI